ncbi:MULTISPECIES: hypothetical protein [unclassified Rhizobium]|uniref:hypothetical protein n=1 Tax=unclassified Rhizobium TaxID=2613769 RepID=UPI001FE1E028|nr:MULTISPECIES: hypothetical protein [unclassified Rhizobium]
MPAIRRALRIGWLLPRHLQICLHRCVARLGAGLLALRLTDQNGRRRKARASLNALLPGASDGFEIGLIQYVGFDAGFDKHFPGPLAEKGIVVGGQAKAPGRIVFLASDGRPTEKEVAVGFFWTSNCFRHAITDTQINGLRPAALATIKNHGHFQWCSDIVIETPVAAKSFAIYEKSIAAIMRGAPRHAAGEQPGRGRPASGFTDQLMDLSHGEAGSRVARERVR